MAAAPRGLVVVDGSQLRELLATLPIQLRRKYARRGLREAANIVRDSAQGAAPRRTGKLAQAIRVRAAKRRRADAVGVNVVLGKEFFRGPTFYGAFLEFGYKTGPRSGTVKTRRGRAAWTGTRRQIPARRFLQRTAERVGPYALAEAVATIKTELEAIRRGVAK